MLVMGLECPSASNEFGICVMGVFGMAHIRTSRSPHTPCLTSKSTKRHEAAKTIRNDPQTNIPKVKEWKGPNVILIRRKPAVSLALLERH